MDSLEIDPGDNNWVIRLNDALEHSRYLVLILSQHTGDRPWIIQKWTSWMAGNGPLGRLLPVTLDAGDLPFILKSTQVSVASAAYTCIYAYLGKSTHKVFTSKLLGYAHGPGLEVSIL